MLVGEQVVGEVKALGDGAREGLVESHGWRRRKRGGRREEGEKGGRGEKGKERDRREAREGKRGARVGREKEKDGRVGEREGRAQREGVRAGGLESENACCQKSPAAQRGSEKTDRDCRGGSSVLPYPCLLSHRHPPSLQQLVRVQRSVVPIPFFFFSFFFLSSRRTGFAAQPAALNINQPLSFARGFRPVVSVAGGGAGRG